MRTYTYGIVVVLITGLFFCGCAKKEVVKAEEPAVPAVKAVPEPPPPPPPAPAPAPLKAEVVPEQVIIPTKDIVPAETAQKVTLEAIHFDFDKYDLRAPDRDILARNAGMLQGKLKGNVRIEGHCDERGSAEYNLALGEKRARSALKYLITLGVPADRLSIISYGKEKPVDPGHDEEAWAKNRRAEFIHMGE